MPAMKTVENRYVPLDWLRGMALLGMFVVHFHMQSSEPGGIDEAVRMIIWRLVESKSHGTFALLFGAGFALLLRRAEARGESITARYLRRLGVLALFGFAAHACFGYNVLLGYAIWGVPLLLVREWSTRALLVVAILSVLSVPLYRIGEAIALQATGGPDALAAAVAAQQAAAADVNRSLRAAELQSSYAVLFAARLRHMAWFYAQPFSFLPGATLALFIAGLLFIRHRVFEDVRAHVPLIRGVIVFGAISWFTANWLAPGWNLPTFGLVRDQWLTFAYLGVALLAIARFPAVVGRTMFFATAGRMALTNYLLQIAALDLLFSGYAVGLGEIRPIFGIMAALACFAAEAAISVVWLRYFQFGPAEWIWRSLTYGEAQPMLRGTTAEAAYT